MHGSDSASSHAVCPALAQVIDYELDERLSDEIGSAFQSLCCMVLLRTALAVSHRVSAVRSNTTEAHNKRVARRWIKGGVGALTFETVCESLDLDPEYARKSLHRYVESVADGTIRKARKPKNHIAFGRSHVADSFARGSDSPAC